MAYRRTKDISNLPTVEQMRQMTIEDMGTIGSLVYLKLDSVLLIANVEQVRSAGAASDD